MTVSPVTTRKSPRTETDVQLTITGEKAFVKCACGKNVIQQSTFRCSEVRIHTHVQTSGETLEVICQGKTIRAGDLSAFDFFFS